MRKTAGVPKYEFMRPLMSPILCHRSSLESQKSVAVLDKIGSYRTSSTVSFISLRWFSEVLGGPTRYVHFLELAITHGDLLRV